MFLSPNLWGRHLGRLVILHQGDGTAYSQLANPRVIPAGIPGPQVVGGGQRVAAGVTLL